MLIIIFKIAYYCITFMVICCLSFKINGSVRMVLTFCRQNKKE